MRAKTLPHTQLGGKLSKEKSMAVNQPTAANDFWKDRLKPRGFGCVCAKRSSTSEE